MTRLASLAFFAVLVSVSIASAEDWPKWLGPRGDNISKEEIASSWPADGPKRVWSIPVGDGHASPVAMDGKVYVFSLNGNQETLACVDAASGKDVWRKSYSISRKPQYAGTRATPTIEDNRIYTLGEIGDLVCRDLADGKEVWRTNVLEETGANLLMWGCASSPLIVAHRIFVQTGEGGPFAVAVNKADGKIEWKAEGKTKAGYASLVYADIKGGEPQLLIFAGKALGGIDPETGKTIWGDDFETEYDVNATTPIFHEGRALFSAEYSNGRSAMYAILGKSAKKVWENKNLKSKFQPVILEDGVVYGNSSGKLTCIDWETGRLIWQAKDRNLDLKPGGSILRVSGGKMITLSDRGRLSLVQATPKGYQLISQLDLFDADQIWASPLLYEGKLYCKGRDELVCLDVGGK